VSAVIQFGHSGSGTVGARTYRREYRFFVAARGERGDPVWTFRLMRGRRPHLQNRIWVIGAARGFFERCAVSLQSIEK